MSVEKKSYKPGERAPKSGQYLITNVQGKIMARVHVTKGRPLPPTPAHGHKYVLEKATSHRTPGSEDLARLAHLHAVNQQVMASHPLTAEQLEQIDQAAAEDAMKVHHFCQQCTGPDR